MVTFNVRKKKYGPFLNIEELKKTLREAGFIPRNEEETKWGGSWPTKTGLTCKGGEIEEVVEPEPIENYLRELEKSHKKTRIYSGRMYDLMMNPPRDDTMPTPRSLRMNLSSCRPSGSA